MCLSALWCASLSVENLLQQQIAAEHSNACTFLSDCMDGRHICYVCATFAMDSFCQNAIHEQMHATVTITGFVVHCWNPETEAAKKLRYLWPQYGQELKIKGHKSGIGTEDLYVSKWKYYGGLSFLEGRNATGKPLPTISNLEVLHTYRDSADNTTEEKSSVFSLIRLLSSRTCGQ